MAEILDRVNKHLPKYRQSRTKFCGAPMPTMIRDDGTTIEGATYRCGDRFCAHCARLRAQRVYACVLRSVSENATFGIPREVRTGVMVTLTQEKPRGQKARDLKNARDIQSEIQKEAHKRLRRHDYAVQRIARHTASGAHHKIGDWIEVAKKSLPFFDHEKLKNSTPPPIINPLCGYAHASGNKTTYIWAREVTPGGKNSRYDGWHVHSHYLVPTIDDAYRLISAHLAACKKLGISASIAEQMISMPQSPDSREGKEPGDDLIDAARYITQYITKSGLDDVADDLLDAYIYGMHGARQYDAAGRWRPLGIGKKRDENAPRVVAVRETYVGITDDGEIVERAMERSFVDFMRQKGAWWGSQRLLAAKRPLFFLDQYKTKLTKSDLVDEIKNIAVDWIDSGKNFDCYPMIFDASHPISGFI